MEQLYVVRYYPSNVMFFIASVRQIALILNLHQMAVERIVREASTQGQCVLHGNGKKPDYLVKPIALQHD